MTEKALTKTEKSRDGDYRAALRACGEVLPGEEGDLRAKLDNALKAGWTIEALKAHAFAVWRKPDCDRVTEAAWRLSVEFADSNGCSGGRDFLKRFNADPERSVRRADGGEPH
jgi:hypothetical protein